MHVPRCITRSNTSKICPPSLHRLNTGNFAPIPWHKAVPLKRGRFYLRSFDTLLAADQAADLHTTPSSRNTNQLGQSDSTCQSTVVCTASSMGHMTIPCVHTYVSPTTVRMIVYNSSDILLSEFLWVFRVFSRIYSIRQQSYYNQLLAIASLDKQLTTTNIEKGRKIHMHVRQYHRYIQHEYFHSILSLFPSPQWQSLILNLFFCLSREKYTCSRYFKMLEGYLARSSSS